MWTKALIFIVVFFIVANPATFKIMRRFLGAWVASAEGQATPAGLLLHGAVFVALAVAVPKFLMANSYYADYEDDDEEFEDEDDGEGYEEDDEEFEDEDDEGFRRRSSRSSRRSRKTRRARRCPAGCVKAE